MLGAGKYAVGRFARPLRTYLPDVPGRATRGRIEGIDRPALGVPIPSADAVTFMLDVGATVRDTRPLPYPEALQPLYLISPVDLPAGCLCGPMPVPGAIPKVCYRFSASVTSLVLPEFTPGVKLAYLGHMLGGYAGIYSNFSNHHPSYQALSDGSADGFPVWTSGASAVDRLFVTVGPVLRLTDRFSMYGGLGYGMRRLCWEDSEGTWMEIDDISRRGLCAELGASFRLGRVELSAGWLGLPFSYNALSLSAGFTFGRSYLKY